jgi:adenylate cyclase
MERKLAAILAADVAGYSRLMGADEAGTFARLKAHRKELFEPEIARHHGRIFKLMGDGLLAEFGSALDAVECAVAVQRQMAERNRGLPGSERIDVRMGVHVGDVIVEDEDRHGDAVNVAARLQQLAEPGGICASRPVVDHIRQRAALHFELRGEERLKNIAEPVSVYRVLAGHGPGRRSLMALPLRRWRWAAAAVVVLAIVAGAGVWKLYPRWQDEPLTGSPTTANSSPEPALAVLPFTNMSGDPAEDYLGAGVAEDIITVLSTFPTLRVVSRMSSFTYDKPVRVQQVGQELGVRYVLEGSVRKAAHRVRVTAQLIDAQTGDHVWANRFDEEAVDVVALQEQVANQIYVSLAGLTGEVRKDEEQHSWSKSTPSLEEYDYYLRGHQLFFHFTADDNARAQQVWREGLARFPNSTLLRIKLGFSYMEPIVEGWSEPTEDDIETAWQFGKQAEAAENKSRLETWLCHWLMAVLYQWHDQDFERSIVEAKAAVQMVPHDALSLAALGNWLAAAGRTDEAIAWIEGALRRDPHGPPWWTGNLAWAYYLGGRYEDSLGEWHEMSKPSRLGLAAVQVRLGRVGEARATVAEFRKDNPGWTLEKEARWPLIEPLKQNYLEDLRQAGLPDG